MATLANLVKNIDPPVEITQEEYNNLTEEQKNDGTVYYIVDGSSSFQTAATTPAEASDGTGSNVQAELDKRLEVSKLVNGGTATEAGYALDARYGKTLADQVSSLNSSISTINSKLDIAILTSGSLLTWASGLNDGMYLYRTNGSVTDAPVQYAFGYALIKTNNRRLITFDMVTSDAYTNQFQSGQSWKGWKKFSMTSVTS